MPTFMLVMANDKPHTDYEKVFEDELLPQIDALFTFAYHLTNYREEDANDLVQETYFKAYKAIDRYHQGSTANALINHNGSITRRSYITMMRKPAPTPVTSTCGRRCSRI